MPKPQLEFNSLPVVNGDLFGLCQPPGKITLRAMPHELLSVCIPTRNRAPYLKDLLAAFARQMREENLGPEDVVFYLSDNTSTDATPEVIRQFAAQVPKAVCHRNPANIGADRNILHVRTMGRGEYTWVIGDDELLADKALVKLLHLLRQREPGLVLAYNTQYDLRLRVPQTFADYRAFAQECLRTNVHALAHHSLISSNIYRSDYFDFDFARQKLHTFYPHLYGMIRPLFQKRATVVLPDFPIIIMRETPAAAVDGVWPSDLDAIWIDYFKWLREELQLPELDPNAPSEYARRALMKKMFRHPFRLFASNWRSLWNPKAYRFVFNRLFRKKH
jgi:glycosyltransferase involved in cell wall biosynthesis